MAQRAHMAHLAEMAQQAEVAQQAEMETPESPSVKRKRVETNTSNDQEASKSAFAVKIFRRQYLDEKTSDVYFICGPKKVRVPAHKSILSKASDAFDGMFYGPIAEKGDVKLPKTSPDAFKDFLQFCYLDEVNLSLEHIVEIMDLTNKYCMPECLAVCGRFWAKHLTFDDLCCAYHWAIFYEEKEFKEFCERKISAYPQLVFESSSFLRCEYVVLEHILNLDSLLCDETFVLGACLDWARHACERAGLDSSQMTNLRNFLKESLYKIRYGSMTVQQFCEHMNSNDGLFTDVREYEDIIRLLSGSKELKTGRFNPKPRGSNIFQWNEEKALQCRINYMNSSIFVSNKPVLLGGFYCASTSEATKWRNTQVDMTITQQPKDKSSDKSTPEVILNKRVKLSANEETFIKLAGSDEQPIIIKPEFKYHVHFKPLTTGLFGYAAFNHCREIDLGAETTIQFPQEDIGEDSSLIKCFKFNCL